MYTTFASQISLCNYKTLVKKKKKRKGIQGCIMHLCSERGCVLLIIRRDIRSKKNLESTKHLVIESRASALCSLAGTRLPCAGKDTGGRARTDRTRRGPGRPGSCSLRHTCAGTWCTRRYRGRCACNYCRTLGTSARRYNALLMTL